MLDEHPMQVIETINANHMQIARFSDADDEGYRQVSMALLSHVKQIQ